MHVRGIESVCTPGTFFCASCGLSWPCSEAVDCRGCQEPIAGAPYADEFCSRDCFEMAAEAADQRRYQAFHAGEVR